MHPRKIHSPLLFLKRYCNRLYTITCSPYVLLHTAEKPVWGCAGSGDKGTDLSMSCEQIGSDQEKPPPSCQTEREKHKQACTAWHACTPAATQSWELYGHIQALKHEGSSSAADAVHLGVKHPTRVCVTTFTPSSSSQQLLKLIMPFPNEFSFGSIHRSLDFQCQD